MNFYCLLRLGTCILAYSAYPLLADDVSFTISGTFNCQNVAGAVAGCGTDTIEFGLLTANQGVQISYEQAQGVLDVTPYSYAPYGRFVSSCLDGLMDCGAYDVPTGLSLSLFATISQFGGFNSTAGFSFAGGDLPLGVVYGGGSIGGSNSMVMFSWPGTQDPGGGYLFLNGTYFFFQRAGSGVTYGLTPPASGDGSTTLEGVISTFRPNGNPINPPTIPEPATWVLALSGLCLTGLMKLWRRA